MAYPLLLHPIHQQYTDAFEPWGEWVVPWHYQDPATEYQILQKGTALLDVSYYALIEVYGKDRADFLQRLLSNNIKRLQSGNGCRAFLLDANAKIQSDLIVLAHPDCLWLLTDAGHAHNTLAALERYHFSEAVHFANGERSHAVLSLRGPKTIEIALRVFDTLLSIPAPYDHTTLNLHGAPVTVIRNPLPTGIELLCCVPQAQGRALWEALQHTGGPLGLHAIGWQAYETARIELGIPAPWIDYDHTNLLPETGLQDIGVSENKGCYLGQEIVARMQSYGSANKLLRGLKLQGSCVPPTRTPLFYKEVEAGWITSACYSPHFQQPVALGYVKRNAYATGTQIDVVLPDQRVSAGVCALPLISA
jgi:folate-binding protein YgfZ